MRERLAAIEITPPRFEMVALLALVSLSLIVLTGAAVRLSGSGLGCPDWPRCYGHVYPPLRTHAVIEFSNRIVSGLVGIMSVMAALCAWRRRPFRRDLLALGVALPLGVAAQAVLGGYTVENKLAPGFVMAHFSLSMVILVAAEGTSPPGAQRGHDAHDSDQTRHDPV
jgi:cytochrome c oxidase assembly protein subunit 15